MSIRNFRALQDLEVPRLGRVNLIVGKNNSGKSSILEALRIYAQQASHALLDELVASHDETLTTQVSPGTYDIEQVPYEHFFTGRKFPSNGGGAIYIGDQAERDFVRIAHTFYVEEHITDADGLATTRRIPRTRSEIGEEDEKQALLISSSRREQPRWLSTSGSGRTWRAQTQDPTASPVGYVPTSTLPPSGLADLWDRVALTDYDKVVLGGLKIIEPRVEGIAFVKRATSHPRGQGARTAILRLEGSEHPVPLNSMGDGMIRVLQLLLLLIPARGGLYLVDEFENGLHYSVQEKVWEMIFSLAKTYDIQVFAATHSWDCIDAFKNVSLRSSEPALLFRVGQSVKTSEKGKTIATTFDKEALAKMTQMDVEVR
ncbi:MAG: ATP-binding protein [Byssovorax sp.]